MARRPDPTAGKRVERVHPAMPGAAGRTARSAAVIAREELHKATLRFTKRTRISGVSFVLLGVRLWGDELCSVNRESAIDYLRALADLYEAQDHEVAMNAEGRRADAVKRLIDGVVYMPPEQKP